MPSNNIMQQTLVPRHSTSAVQAALRAAADGVPYCSLCRNALGRKELISV